MRSAQYSTNWSGWMIRGVVLPVQSRIFGEYCAYLWVCMDLPHFSTSWCLMCHHIVMSVILYIYTAQQCRPRVGHILRLHSDRNYRNICLFFSLRFFQSLCNAIVLSCTLETWEDLTMCLSSFIHYKLFPFFDLLFVGVSFLRMMGQ